MEKVPYFFPPTNLICTSVSRKIVIVIVGERVETKEFFGIDLIIVWVVKVNVF
jgi:hypothetical protein